MGNEIGTVWIRTLHPERSIEIAAFPNLLSVHQLTWAEDGSYLACADLGGDVVMFKVETFENVRKVQEVKPRPQLRLDEQGLDSGPPHRPTPDAQSRDFSLAVASKAAT